MLKLYGKQKRTSHHLSIVVEDKLNKTAKPKKDEEDFWVFGLRRDDSQLPTWNERVTIMGSYEQRLQLCADAIDALIWAGISRSGIT